MHVLSYTLNPDGVARMHDALQCLAKFSDTVSLEARTNHVRASRQHQDAFSLTALPRSFCCRR